MAGRMAVSMVDTEHFNKTVAPLCLNITHAWLLASGGVEVKRLQKEHSAIQSSPFSSTF